jgi:hypothetical protein
LRVPPAFSLPLVAAFIAIPRSTIAGPQATGVISGTVTSLASGARLPDVSVTVYDTERVLWSQRTDSTGTYTTMALPAGTYFVRAEAATAYLAQIYSGLNYSGRFCPSGAAASPVAVVGGAVTGNIDFALVRGGTISGTVIAAATGTPLAGVRPSPTTGTAASVTQAATTAGIDFAQVRGGVITEMRAALAAAYVAAGRTPPSWTPPAIVAGETTITAANISELRAAVAALW